MKLKETDLIKLICDYLEAKGEFFYRNNTGGFRTETGHFYRYGAVGSPDIIIVKNGKYIGVEAKVGKNKMSPAQMTFAENLIDAGGKYILVRDNLDDLILELTLYNP